MTDTQTSQKAVRPEAKETVEMPPPPAWAIALSEKVNDGFRAVRADIGLVANDVSILRERVVVIERWQLDTEVRIDASSKRAQEPSQHDLELKTEVNAEREAREALAKEVAETKALVVENTEATLAIKKAVVGITTNPKVKTAAKALFYLIVAAAAAKGWVLK